MSMRLAPIWDPSARKPGPRPVHVDLFPPFCGGTIVWLVATIVTSVLYANGAVGMDTPVICGFGVLVGLGLLIWEHRERNIYMLLGEDETGGADGAGTDDADTDSTGADTDGTDDENAADNADD